ncbi:MAG: DUF6715 family protein [Lachnospiraceae bacterium]
MKKLKFVLIALICGTLILGYYLYLANKNNDREVSELTEVQNLIVKDLDKTYPPTPREVVVVYNSYLEALYNEEYTEEEYEQLVDQIRLLLDDELLEQNSRELYVATLEQEIDGYKEKEQTIRYSEVSDSTQVQYKTVDDRECAYVDASYLLNDSTGKDLTKTYQQYVLRKGESDGRWKILGFVLTEGESE